MAFFKASYTAKIPAGISTIKQDEVVLWGVFPAASGTIVITRRKESSDGTLVDEPAPTSIAVTAGVTKTLDTPVMEQNVKIDNQTGNNVLLLFGSPGNSIRGGGTIIIDGTTTFAGSSSV
jgi:hypothetical protein